MGDKSTIEWTHATWNPTVGCTKVSPGCKNCYAEVMHRRLGAMGMVKYSEPFETVRPWPTHLQVPLHWKKPRLIFVNSMSDLFHADVPDEYIAQVFEIMGLAKQHTFQVLTKRSKRLSIIAPNLSWPENVWMGVSVEDQERTFRIDHLRTTPSAVRFLSVEPLLGPIPELSLDGIDWVIVGGESGRKARPMETNWAREIRDQCRSRSVPFFLKQLGGRRNKRGGAAALLDGTLCRELPVLTQGKQVTA